LQKTTFIKKGWGEVDCLGGRGVERQFPLGTWVKETVVYVDAGRKKKPENRLSGG